MGGARHKGLLDGQDDNEAKERGIVVAVRGAKARLGQRGCSHQDDEVKRFIRIPATGGAKITGEQFRERASKFEPKPG